jgi:glycosyltransferase involved in cell wall biosynthesis
MLHVKKKFDVVHIHNMPDILVLSGLIPKWLGATLLLDVHDPMSELFQVNYHVSESNLLIRAIKWQERLCYRLPDHLLTVSHPMADNVAEKSGRPVEVIKVIHNFSDLKKFPVCEDARRWPRNENSFVVLYAGTVTEHYGLDIAVRAIAAAARHIRNIRLRILGDGNRLPQVLSLANELGIDDRVEHIKKVGIEFVKDIMADADVGISTHRGGVFAELYFSNKVIDFMTQGVPVVCSHTYTLDRYIPEDAIFFFEPDNIENLVKRLIQMYDNPLLVQNKIKNAYKLVAKYNWQVERERLIGFYKGLLSEKGANSPHENR